MLNRNAVSKCKPKAGSFLLSLAHERFEEALANVLRDARPLSITLRQSRPAISRVIETLPASFRATDRLAGIEQQVENGSFDLLSVDNKPGLGRIAVMRHRASRPPHRDARGPARQHVRAVCAISSGDFLCWPGTAEDQQGFDHVCRAKDRRADVREDLGSLFSGKPVGGEELRVGIYGGKIVTEDREKQSSPFGRWSPAARIRATPGWPAESRSASGERGA